ncbi:Response regulator receiver domain-containing protein [Desulfomicrobium apsheronum]|uniref:Response regulator receiver domain-containing protein n=1 Tax=Desulfomicrobium apsheronum TaxID=52560 RepID=A0A1I3VFK0_9BACT|nr:response regulator transcription factor [Desulfomicrobium apsheronum]MDY0227289.1 response regulator transcription factor [Desulfomicrobium apsheronum]SFJ93962.1 Response regulator receiver domain-containing protein [Desulfomicrobium apsheronum]
MDEPSILLIDDEEAFVTTLQERLEMRGFPARVALDGQSGLDLIAEEPPDVIVLDLRMPGISGVEVLRRIRKQWPGLPVIMLSGHGSDMDFETCVHLGAAMYHKKPLDINTLIESVRAVTQGNQHPQR